jgi:hypothetical protein
MRRKRSKTSTAVFHLLPVTSFMGNEYTKTVWMSRLLLALLRWYGFYVVGYAVMPQHMHVLINATERGSLAATMPY